MKSVVPGYAAFNLGLGCSFSPLSFACKTSNIFGFLGWLLQGGGSVSDTVCPYKGTR